LPHSTHRDPVHVIHLIEGLGSGGAERALYNVLKHLDPARVRSTVVSVNDQLDFWTEPIGALGIEVLTLRCRNHRDIPTGIARFRKLLRERRPDLVHTQLFPANIIGRVAAKLAGVPAITTVQSLEYAPETWSTPALRVKRLIARAADRWTAHLQRAAMIAISEAVRRSASEDLHIAAAKFDLIPNGVDFAELDDFPTGRPLREELGLGPDDLVLLMVARTVPQKGIEYAIPALPRILERHPAAHLVCAGANTNRAWLSFLQGEAQSHGVASHVHFLGERHDIPHLLRECDLFLFPSTVEGQGVALIEAMAVGCACVASDIEALAQIITEGVDGWLVPVKDPAALAERVTALLADPEARARAGRTAAENVRHRFSAAIAAERLTAVYQRVARASSGDARGNALRPTAP
jgi:glycosyltransferase involved in cell wall biosynthesis